MGSPLVFADSDVAFFLFAKDAGARTNVADAIDGYVRNYPVLHNWALSFLIDKTVFTAVIT